MTTSRRVFVKMHAVARHYTLKSLCPARRIHNGPPRKGLLKYVDLAETRDGSVGCGFLTSLLRKANNSREVREIVNEARRFEGTIPWQLLSAAAHVSAGPSVDDPQLAGTLLASIPPKDIPYLWEGVLRAVLGNASRHKNGAVALNAFRLLVARNIPLTTTDYARVIHSGIDSSEEEARLVHELLQQPCPTELDPRTIGVLLKVCHVRHDLDLAGRVWQWAAPRRHVRHGDLELCYVTAQYLLLCGRTGNMAVAQQVWQEARDMGLAHIPVVTGSMLSVLAAHGADGETLELLKDIPPTSLNSYMVTAALTAFSHSGNVDAARALLEQVEVPGSQTPGASIQSYTALVDGYARRGDFASALAIIDRAKCQSRVGEDDVMWMTVLGPCRDFKNLPVAQTAFEAIQRLGSPEHRASAYVLMSDVYKACGDTTASLRMQQERLKKRLMKKRGAVTLTMDNGKTHVFYVREIPPELVPATPAMEQKLEEWSRWLGLCGISDESIRCRHSEKLALAYAVTQGMKKIVLRKNLRICGACHEASKQITILESISIHHWDRSRVHIMKDGKCSCHDRY
jgi:pentatricopeptide repeat protein